MQTFLPFPDFERSARALDTKRLGKQRVEVIQVVRALTRSGYGWGNHPAVLMWKGHEEALGRYGLTAGVTEIRSEAELRAADVLPTWLGDDAFHRGHQSSLVRKDPDHYGPLFPDTPDDLPYVWPVRSAKVLEAERRKAERAVRRATRTSRGG
jgi:hypothetical protein